MVYFLGFSVTDNSMFHAVRHQRFTTEFSECKI